MLLGLRKTVPAEAPLLLREPSKQPPLFEDLLGKLLEVTVVEEVGQEVRLQLPAKLLPFEKRKGRLEGVIRKCCTAQAVQKGRLNADDGSRCVFAMQPPLLACKYHPPPYILKF